MTLDEYYVFEMKNLADFRRAYLTDHGQHPKDFPLEMDEGEWFEKFIVFDGGEG